jgi:hypothetical protein
MGEAGVASPPPRVALHSSEPTRSNGWQYDDRRVILRAGGAGNNWAIGNQVLGPDVVRSVIKSLLSELCSMADEGEAAPLNREEIARLCQLSTDDPRVTRILDKASVGAAACGGFLLLQSTAGGTGSGVGAAVAQAVTTAFPGIPLVAVAVGSEGRGAGGGAVCVGHLNAALSLFSLMSHCDGVVSVSNDELDLTVQDVSRHATPTLESMNKVLADRLVAWLLPCTVLARTGDAEWEPARRCRPIHDTLEALGMWPREGFHPGKLLGLVLCPVVREEDASFTTVTWPGVMRRTRLAIASGACSDCRLPARGSAWREIESLGGVDWTETTEDERLGGSRAGMDPPKARWDRALHRSLESATSECSGLFVVARGADEATLRKTVAPMLRALEHPMLVGKEPRGLSASGSPLRLTVCCSPRPMCGLTATVACVCQRRAEQRQVRRTAQRAASLLVAKAYLHHFSKHGVSLERLQAALRGLWRE